MVAGRDGPVPIPSYYQVITGDFGNFKTSIPILAKVFDQLFNLWGPFSIHVRCLTIGTKYYLYIAMAWWAGWISRLALSWSWRASSRRGRDTQKQSEKHR